MSFITRNICSIRYIEVDIDLTVCPLSFSYLRREYKTWKYPIWWTDVLLLHKNLVIFFLNLPVNRTKNQYLS